MPKPLTLPVVSIDKKLKKKLYKSCKALGISYSALITLFIKNWLSGEVSLNICHIDETDYLLSAKANKKHLMNSLQEEKEGRVKEGTIENMKSML